MWVQWGFCGSAVCMGVPDPLCLFWGGVSLRGASSWILGGFVIPGTLAPSILGPRHISAVVCLTVSRGEARLPVVTGVVVGGWKQWRERSSGKQFVSRSHWHGNCHETPNCTWRSRGHGVSLSPDRHADPVNLRRAFGGNRVFLVQLAPASRDGVSEECRVNWPVR